MTNNIICCPSGTNYDSTAHSECPCVNCWADRAAARLKGDNRDQPLIVEVVIKSETIEDVAQGVGVAAAVETECEVPPNQDASAKPKLSLLELVGGRQVEPSPAPTVKQRQGWASWLAAVFLSESVDPAVSEAETQQQDDKGQDRSDIFDPRIKKLSPGIFLDENTGRTYTEGQLDLLVHHHQLLRRLAMRDRK